MKNLIVIILFLPIGCFSADSEIAKQSFQEFDQTMGSGWRALVDTGKYKEAALLIVRYIAEGKDIEPYRPILNFHAGQCFAYAGEIDQAVNRLQQAYQAEKPPSYASVAKQWNAYVRGTIAFLRGEKKELEKCRDEVATGPDESMKKSNADALDRLLRGFGKGYLEAYRGIQEAQQGA